MMLAASGTSCTVPARRASTSCSGSDRMEQEAATASIACIPAQGNTILAMDFMENGTLWDQLPRTNKAGQRIFQWKCRGKKVAYAIALGLHCLHDLK